jgi:hypothetical protein
MQLSLRLLDDVCDVNSFELASELAFTSGDPQDVYIQLVDATRARKTPDSPAIRYMPAAGATLSLLFDSIDIDKQVTKVATQPFVDTSIWTVSLTAQDAAKLRGTVNMVFTLTIATRVVTGRLNAALTVS